MYCVFSKGFWQAFWGPLKERHGLDSMDLIQRFTNIRGLGMRVGPCLRNDFDSIMVV